MYRFVITETVFSDFYISTYADMPYIFCYVVACGMKMLASNLNFFLPKTKMCLPQCKPNKCV